MTPSLVIFQGSMQHLNLYTLHISSGGTYCINVETLSQYHSLCLYPWETGYGYEQRQLLHFIVSCATDDTANPLVNLLHHMTLHRDWKQHHVSPVQLMSLVRYKANCYHF